MRQNQRTRAGRGIALPEVLAAAAVVGVLVSLVVVAGWRTRSQAMAGRDLANLRMIAGWTNSYAADHQELYWTYSWHKGEFRSRWPDLNNAATNMQAAADQAVDILRRRTGREEIPRITGWLPSINFGHLTLADYAGLELPSLRFVAAGDVHRTRWAKDFAAFDEGRFLPFQPHPSPVNTRWPYSASFQCPPAWVERAGGIGQAGHNSYLISQTALFGGAPISDAAFPSQKVLMHDAGAWYFGRPVYFAHEQARATMLMADGSAATRSTADANPGWMAGSPSHPDPILFAYVPLPWEPPTVSGEAAEAVVGHYRWTRGGIEGIDFGGPEINTGQR